MGLATSAVLVVAALAPSGASAIEIQTRQVQTETLFITAKQSFVNQVGINWVISPSGAPDIVIGDTRAGIPDPIPAPCARVDATIARCPANSFNQLNMDLGPGNDVVILVKPLVGVDGFIRMELELGLGADRASDLGNTRDIWNGGPGRDQLRSGPGNDRVRGGGQNDLIDCGGGAHDVGIGGAGRDLGRKCEVVKH